jgi:uncharacterized protein YjiS (DUF1127 family)
MEENCREHARFAAPLIARGGRGRHLYHAAILVARRIQRRLRIGDDQRRLLALPDYPLSDIGISRGEISSAKDSAA